MSEPLVSILIPTYQRPGLLAQAIASAVGQSYANLQIVVRDNASGDTTPAVVNSFNDPRIEFHQASENAGAYQNSCECTRLARGEYLLFLCDDDILGGNYVETLVGFMEADAGITVAYGATDTIDENGAVTGHTAPDSDLKLDAPEIVQAWCAGSLPIVSAIHFLCRKSFFWALADRIGFPGGHNSDNAVFMAGGMRGKVLFTGQCVFYYRVHSLNSWKSFPLELRTRGDNEFLQFLDEEAQAESNLNLPREEWPTLRGQLNLLLTSVRYSHEIQALVEESARRASERDRAKARLVQSQEKELKLREKLAIAEKKLISRHWLTKWWKR